MNDHYHRPKRKIIQKMMEASGENPKECITQSEIDKLSELDSVSDAFRAMNLDPHALNLRLCDDDPPDCQANDSEGNLVGLEITGIYDQDVERSNAKAQTIKKMVYRDWTEDDLVAEITRMITRGFLGARGRRFKSGRPDQFFQVLTHFYSQNEPSFVTGLVRFSPIDSSCISTIGVIRSPL